MAFHALQMDCSFTGRAVCFKHATPRTLRRTGLTVECKESRIGKKVINVPKGVSLTIDGQLVKVKGPKGELQRDISDLIEIKREDDQIRLFRREQTRKASELHGLSRSLIENMVRGTSDGFTKVLELVGVGYRAASTKTSLTLNLGFSHPVELAIPEGLTVEVEKNTRIYIRGYDKEVVGQFAATIRGKRPPEPYKGKGVRYQGEFIKIKEGKKGK